MVIIKLKRFDEGAFVLDADLERILRRVFTFSGLVFDSLKFIFGAGLGNESDADYVIIKTKESSSEVEEKIKTALPKWCTLDEAEEFDGDESLFAVKRISIKFDEKVEKSKLLGLEGGDILAIDADGKSVCAALKKDADTTKVCEKIAAALGEERFDAKLEAWLTLSGEDVEDI